MGLRHCWPKGGKVLEVCYFKVVFVVTFKEEPDVDTGAE